MPATKDQDKLKPCDRRKWIFVQAGRYVPVWRKGSSLDEPGAGMPAGGVLAAASVENDIAAKQCVSTGWRMDLLIR
jgi:hypothetical protein